ncbi:MAG: GNAT family N-acetyltransferase [Bacilli bacterium]|nr:GNAT family N-acetyltransferase [Bacilli bacterium]MDD3389621.1 GNAT family N-acetyltransferase [Bacilli bacterium]MDD4345254.1 GNAT family N-acetyltransferase [Bacilli bacterium]MDD4521201.1 GNAT family N-acetyltransferase [Bacilli bacterium]MDY0399425.1 GNAT family N-acetyltransferase [Bacilli bacterium]
MARFEFIEDKDFKYNDDIIKGLQAFNRSQTGYREKDKQNFYVCQVDDILGACHTKMSSDWCHIKRIYYKNLDVLKNLLNDIKEYYCDKAEGIQFSCVIPSVVTDFKSLGYVEKGRLEDMPKGGENVFLLNTDFTPYETSKDYEVQVTDEHIKHYDEVLKQENRKMRKSLNFSSETVDIQFVVLDNGKFVGGIYGNFKYDYLFINVLYVKEKYRGRNIATKLMDLIEKEAEQRGFQNLYLTTFEFQALGFYKKRGYKKIMEIYDYPKGFKEYTVYKSLAHY